MSRGFPPGCLYLQRPEERDVSRVLYAKVIEKEKHTIDMQCKWKSAVQIPVARLLSMCRFCV